jgi:hypothetical protein
LLFPLGRKVPLPHGRGSQCGMGAIGFATGSVSGGPCVTILLMLTDQILVLLMAERDKLNRAIEALQGPTKRRGRPPKNPLTVTASAAAPVAKKRKGRTFSAAQRKAAGERMRLRWAAKRKAEGSSSKAAAKSK